MYASYVHKIFQSATKWEPGCFCLFHCKSFGPSPLSKQYPICTNLNQTNTSPNVIAYSHSFALVFQAEACSRSGEEEWHLVLKAEARHRCVCRSSLFLTRFSDIRDIFGNALDQDMQPNHLCLYFSDLDDSNADASPYMPVVSPSASVNDISILFPISQRVTTLRGLHSSTDDLLIKSVLGQAATPCIEWVGAV